MHSEQLDIFGRTHEVKPCTFDQDAYGFLVRFAGESMGRAFSSEDVTLAAVKAGIVPARDLRSWGSIFVRAARDGHIRRCRALFRRSLGNSTLAPGWVAA